MFLVDKFIKVYSMDSLNDIKDRLSHILRAKNLTATQFAEMMKIQPSNVSHLLSGRNKPSLDFLIKLKEIFPEYNYDWIILGKKPITNVVPDSPFKNELFELEEEDAADKSDVVFNEIHDNVEVKETCLPINNETDSSKGLKQIIYVYEDHTFEVYNIRK